MTAVPTRMRSAIGSSTLPSVDTWPKRRATYPSTQSVAPSTASRMAAAVCSCAPKSSQTKSGMHARRTKVMTLGAVKMRPRPSSSTSTILRERPAATLACGVAEWRGASIRTVPGAALPARPGPHCPGHRPALRRHLLDRAHPPGLAQPGQCRPGRAARDGLCRRARPLRRGHRPLHPLAGGRASSLPDPEPSLYPYRMTDTVGSGHHGGHRRPRSGRAGSRERHPAPRADPAQAQERPPRPAPGDPGQPLAHLGPLDGGGRHRHLRPDRRRAGGRRLRRRRRAPPALGPERPRRRGRRGRRPSPRRRSSWPTGTTATRRPGPTRPSAGRPTAASPGPTTWSWRWWSSWPRTSSPSAPSTAR